MRRYIEEGKKSYKGNDGKYINPYKRGSDAYNGFERGWSQALKRSPERPVKGYKKHKLNSINNFGAI